MPGLLEMMGTGEPPGGMFAQPQQPPPEPPPWESGLSGAPPAGVNLPQGMYYGVDPGWMAGGGPGTGEPDRPAGRPAFYSPGRPTEEFMAANSGITRGDLESPLAYTADEPYRPRDTGGFFTVSDLYRNFTPPRTGAFGNRYPQNPPSLFQVGQNAPSTNNWRLLGMGPGWILRNGNLVKPSMGDRGFASGSNPGGGVSAEHGNITPHIATGTGGAYGFPNLYAPGYAPPLAGWPSAIPESWMPPYGSGQWFS